MKRDGISLTLLMMIVPITEMAMSKIAVHTAEKAAAVSLLDCFAIRAAATQATMNTTKTRIWMGNRINDEPLKRGNFPTGLPMI